MDNSKQSTKKEGSEPDIRYYERLIIAILR